VRDTGLAIGAGEPAGAERHSARGGPRAGSSARRRARSGRVRAWIPFLVVLGGGVWLCESLAGTVRAAGFAVIDPARSRLCDPREIPAGGGFVDERWEHELRGVLAAAPAFEASDAESAASLARRVASLPFVAEVGEPRVVWPDGLEFPLRLRTPVACVRAGDDYTLVSQDGVLLPGTWSTVPWIGQGPLPVLGPNDRAFDGASAGSALVETRHKDALAVARSLRDTLSAADLETLGPVLIDATRARLTSPTEPGVLLRLANKRVIQFGRAPDSGEPGELPAAAKWRAVSKGLELLRSGAPDKDWAVLDVRWDVPAIQWRAPPGG
jgi:hypothetical protein